MGKTGEKSLSISSAKAAQEAKHSGGKWDDRIQVKGVTGLYLNIKILGSCEMEARHKNRQSASNQAWTRVCPI